MDALEQQIQDIVKPLFSVKSITDVNHRPHPYCVGPRHVAWAANEHGGSLSAAAIKDGEIRNSLTCAVPGCRVSFDQHTADKVLFLQLIKDTTSDEVQSYMVKLKPILRDEMIDGIAFVDTPEKFRIT